MPCRAAWSSLQNSLCRPQQSIDEWDRACSLSLVSFFFSSLYPGFFFLTVVTWLQSSCSVEWDDPKLVNISFHTMHRGKFSCATCLRTMKVYACLLALIVIICFLTAYCQLLANGRAYMGDNLYSLFPLIYKPCKIEQKCNIAKVFNGKNFALAFIHRELKSLLFLGHLNLTLVPLSLPLTVWL